MVRARVLIAEDESIVASDLVAHLGATGYLILGVASKGEEVIALSRTLTPDLILMDITLRGSLDGISAAEIIQRESDIPIVYCTAHADAATLHRAKLTGPFGYILKPFQASELESTIETALYKAGLDRTMRESEQRYRLLAESVTELIFVLDPALRVTFVNASTEHVLGYTAGELIGREVACLLSQSAPDPLVQALQRSINGVDTLRHTCASSVETEMLRKDGSTLWVDVAVNVRTGHDGAFRETICVARDVTVRRQADLQVKYDGELARATIDALSVHICLLDAHGIILMVNTAWRRFAGKYDGADDRSHEGDNYLEVCESASTSSDDATKALRGIRSVIDGFCAEFVMRYLCPTPSRTLEFEMRVTRTATDPVRVIVAHQDVTMLSPVDVS